MAIPADVALHQSPPVGGWGRVPSEFWLRSFGMRFALEFALPGQGLGKTVVEIED